MKPPCKECDHRHRACWDNCEEYKEYKQDLEIAKQLQRQETMSQLAWMEKAERLKKYRR